MEGGDIVVAESREEGNHCRLVWEEEGGKRRQFKGQRGPESSDALDRSVLVDSSLGVNCFCVFG